MCYKIRGHRMQTRKICLPCPLISWRWAHDYSALPHNLSAAISLFCNRDFGHIFGQYLFNKLGPFKETEATSIEIIFISHVIHLVKFLDSVEVEMINGTAICRSILVDKSESRRCNHIGYSQFFADCLDKSSLSCAHFAIEREDFNRSNTIQKGFSGLTDVVL